LIEAKFLTKAKEIPTPEERAKWDKPKAGAKKSKTASVPGQAGKRKSQEVKPTATNRLYITQKGREYLLKTYAEGLNLNRQMPITHLTPIMTYVLQGLRANSHGDTIMAQILGLAPSEAMAPKWEPKAEAMAPKGEPKAEGKAPSKEPRTDLTPDKLIRMIKAMPPINYMDSGGLRISVIKNSFPEYAHMAIDQALLDLEKMGIIVIYNFDDPTKITRADKEFGLVRSGVTRHYIFIR
jgi:hypothetical protein